MTTTPLSFGNKIVLVLDGGLGTTLEDTFNKKISNTPLWSAKPINDEPETIVQAHLSFLRAGANILLTSTYQCSYQTFQRAGYTPEQAEATMIKSVQLASDARNRFVSETNGALDDVKIALSLGPFGASLSPAQEFDGYYPPPYGLEAYPSLHVNRNVFNAGEEELEQQSINALTSFHLQRLQLFSKAVDTWNEIDCVAFETVPLLREIRAIKRAVASLYVTNPSLERKPWWISTVFPDGAYPQHGSTTEQVVQTILEDHDLNGYGSTNAATVGIPDGLGINCTSLDFIPRLLDEMTGYLDRHQTLSTPWLVLYPNGGEIYDPISQTWKEAYHADSAKKGDMWAARLLEVVEHYRGRWGGLIIGGCCKTGPNEIGALARNLKA